MTKIPPKKRKTAYRSLRAICKKLGYTVIVGPMKVDTDNLPSDQFKTMTKAEVLEELKRFGPTL